MGDNNASQNEEGDVMITHYEDEYFFEYRYGNSNLKPYFICARKAKVKGKRVNEIYINLLRKYLKLRKNSKLKGKSKNIFPYQDPDDRETVKAMTYYSELTYFLNKRVNEYANREINNYVFLQPDKACKFGESETSEENTAWFDTVKIALIKDSKPQMLLTSDQFGFSAGINKDKEKYALTDVEYPYGMYYNLIKKNDELRFIAQCVYDTRTIGGAFVWPVMTSWEEDKWDDKKRESNYNKIRGRSSYIEDRVDLTLLEIKHMLSFDPSEYSHDILYGEYIKKESHMKEWFDIFGGFNEYVDLLMFNPFVVKQNNVYRPIDIIHSEVKEGDGFNLIGERIETLSDCKDKTGWGIKELYENKDGEGLKRMLNNVRLLTLARSRMMTEFIMNPNEWNENTILQWKKDENGKWKFEINPSSES